MSLLDEIKKKLRLPKSAHTAVFVDIKPDDDDSKSSGSSSRSSKSCKIVSRNVHLYDNDLYVRDEPTYNDTASEFEIHAAIVEAKGGECYSNKDHEDEFLKRIAENELLQKEAEEQERENFIEARKRAEMIAKNKKKTSKMLKHNVLMRGLYEQKMSEPDISKLTLSDSNNGKKTENSQTLNTPVLVQSIEDPDFYFLRDTAAMANDAVDDFRFEHRGTKEKITPIQYALSLPDKCFEFKRDETKK